MSGQVRAIRNAAINRIGKRFAKAIRYATPLIVLSLVIHTAARAQEKPTVPWVAPASAKAVKNPLTATPANLAAAKENYTKICIVCHGEKGDGQGVLGKTLDPKPHDFTDAKGMAMETDGDLFWKLTEGRGAMLSMKDKLSDTERWQLVLYIRTFAKPAAKEPAKN